MYVYVCISIYTYVCVLSRFFYTDDSGEGIELFVFLSSTLSPAHE